MEEQQDGTATQTAKDEGQSTEQVKNAEAVLAKNQELLGKLAREKQEREQLAAKIAQFEQAEAERETQKLEKKGEWEKLRESMESSHKSALTQEQQRYQNLFENSSRYQLAVEIAKQPLAEGASAERLAKLLLLDEIKPTEENGKVVWRRIGTDEEVQLNEFIPSLADAYGEYFAADNNPGGDAPGSNKPSRSGSGKKWADMDLKQRNAAIREFRGDIAAAQKKYS